MCPMLQNAFLETDLLPLFIFQWRDGLVQSCAIHSHDPQLAHIGDLAVVKGVILLLHVESVAT